jgi:hypothetical protein
MQASNHLIIAPHLTERVSFRHDRPGSPASFVPDSIINVPEATSEMPAPEITVTYLSVLVYGVFVAREPRGMGEMRCPIDCWRRASSRRMASAAQVDFAPPIADTSHGKPYAGTCSPSPL